MDHTTDEVIIRIYLLSVKLSLRTLQRNTLKTDEITACDKAAICWLISQCNVCSQATWSLA